METFTSGEIILIPPNLPHGWFFSEFDHDEEGKIENISIFFSDSFLDKLSSSFPEMRHTVNQIKCINKGISFEGETLKSIRKLMNSMKNQDKVEQLLSLISIIYKITGSEEKKVVGSSEKQNKSSLKIQEVTRYMVNNFQHDIKLDDVAKYVGMNKSSFCVFFKREKGKSFFTALTEYRIDSSCLMLRETDLSVTEICYAVGFNDLPHFNRTFKKYKGISPKEFKLGTRQLTINK